MEEDQSPRRFAEGSIDLETSPVSGIANDLYRSSLNSAKKRHHQSFRDVSHRINGHQRNGFFQSVVVKNASPSPTNANLILDLQQKSDGLLQCDDQCDKENCNLSYNSQKVRRKMRCSLQRGDCKFNENDDCEINVVDEKEETRCDVAASRRMSVDSQYSPTTTTTVQSPQSMVSNSRNTLFNLRAFPTGSALLRRLSSGYESMDDGMMSELTDIETMDEETQLPSDISKLLSGNIVAPEAIECDVSTTPEYSRSKFSAKLRWLSSTTCLRNEPETVSPPPLSKIRTCLFRSPTATCSTEVDCERPRDRYCTEANSPLSTKSCKRPSEELPTNEIGLQKRLRKSNSFCINVRTLEPGSAAVNPSCTSAHPKVALQRSLSETKTHIKWAVHRSITDSDLIGDFSKPCVLPLIDSNHVDLKSITIDTLAALLRGEFVDRVASCRVIDCRYPYEYDAGHIEGALNLYTKDLIDQILIEPLNSVIPIPVIQPDTNKRHILVFHCEFSWERGPNLLRFLRSLDRQLNKEHYPALYYPEMYLLHGGYQKFYIEQRQFCSPQEYKPMRHPDHTEECKFFRSKSKNWQGNKSKGNSTQTGRQNLKRLGF